MATGSGKTYVMALSIAWQYFNPCIDTDRHGKNLFMLKNIIRNSGL